jgi:hypothetical protein
MLYVAFGNIDQWTLESPSTGLKVRRHKLVPHVSLSRKNPMTAFSSAH